MTPKRPRTMPEDQERAIRNGAEPWDAVRILCAELDAERAVSDELAEALQDPFSVQPSDVDIHRTCDAALARWQGAKKCIQCGKREPEATFTLSALGSSSSYFCDECIPF